MQKNKEIVDLKNLYDGIQLDYLPHKAKLTEFLTLLNQTYTTYLNNGIEEEEKQNFIDFTMDNVGVDIDNARLIALINMCQENMADQMIEPIKTERLSDTPVLKSVNVSKSKSVDPTFDIINSITGKSFTVIDMVHSGLKLNIDTINDTEMISIYDTLNVNEFDIGKSTLGLIFTKGMYIYEEILVTFLLSKVTQINVEGLSINDLPKYLDFADVPLAVIGILNQVYNDGITIASACNNAIDMEKPAEDRVMCKHVTKATFRLNDLVKIIDDRLDDTIREYRAKNKHTLEELEEYQEYIRNREGLDNKYTIVNEGTKVTFNFEYPNFEKYCYSNELWINAIEKSILDTISDNNNKARLAKKTKYIKTNMLSVFEHFIKSVVVEKDGKSTEYENEGAINIFSILENFSGNTTIIGDFDKAITKYINDYLIAVVGNSTYICDECNKKVSSEEGLEFIPFNPIPLFLKKSQQKESLLTVNQ